MDDGSLVTLKTKKFKATSGHKVVDKTQAERMDEGSPSSGILPTEVCPEHDGEKINDHNISDGDSDIPNTANGCKQSKDVDTNRQGESAEEDPNAKKAYEVELIEEYDVGMPDDKYMSDITGSCRLPDGTIILADWANSCIKKLGDAYFIIRETTSIDRLDMSSVFGVCQVTNDEVAVTLDAEKKVQFVNVRPKLKMTRSFSVPDCPRGICCSRDQLFVSCGGWKEGSRSYDPEGPGFVGVYTMTGFLLRKIQLNQCRRNMFTIPRHITATDNGNKIHVADKDGGVITVDRQGHVLSSFSQGLKSTHGVCAATESNLLVCGIKSNNLVLIDTNGNMISELLSEEDGLDAPKSVLFLGGEALVLTETDNGIIKVFGLVK